jgi:hypothetical protein
MNGLPFIKPPDNCSNCWKGVPNEDYRYGETVSWELFCPHEEDVVIEDWFGSSVNWDLDQNEGAARELLEREKDGKVQFKSGAVRIPRIEIDRIISQYAVDEELTYELRGVENNHYHGHLLFKNTLKRDTNKKRTICGALSKVINGSKRREQQNA